MTFPLWLTLGSILVPLESDSWCAWLRCRGISLSFTYYRSRRVLVKIVSSITSFDRWSSHGSCQLLSLGIARARLPFVSLPSAPLWPVLVSPSRICSCEFCVHSYSTASFGWFCECEADYLFAASSTDVLAWCILASCKGSRCLVPCIGHNPKSYLLIYLLSTSSDFTCCVPCVLFVRFTCLGLVWAALRSSVGVSGAFFVVHSGIMLVSYSFASRWRHFLSFCGVCSCSLRFGSDGAQVFAKLVLLLVQL